MTVNESITIIGAERFSNHTGYSRSTKFAGNFIDKTPTDTKKRLSNVIVCYDALIAKRINQFTHRNMLREITKTYAAVDVPSSVTGEGFHKFATGNWGCGVFGGDIPLKAMLQWIGSSQASKHILYHDFGDAKADGLSDITLALSDANVTVGWLWGRLLAYSGGNYYRQRVGLFEFLEGELSGGWKGKQPIPNFSHKITKAGNLRKQLKF